MHNDSAVYIVTYSNTGSGMDNVNKVCKIEHLLKVFPLFGKHRFASEYQKMLLWYMYLLHSTGIMTRPFPHTLKGSVKVRVGSRPHGDIGWRRFAPQQFRLQLR